MASKKKRTAESIHDRDRIIARLPDGLRDKLAALAEANGRSQTAEIVAAIQKHVASTDRFTELWDFFEKHREHIEAIPDIDSRLDTLESEARPLIEERDAAIAAREWQRVEARRASLPPITAEQAEKIKALIEELDVNEAKFLAVLHASSVAEIKDWEKAMYLLEQRRRFKQNPPA